MSGSTKHCALVISTLFGGGAQRVVLNLAQGLIDRGVRVDLVMSRVRGDLVTEVPHAARVVDLGARRVIGSVPALARYFRRERPDAVVSSLDYVNIASIWAHRLAGAPARLIVTEHNTLSIAIANAKNRRRLLMPALMRMFYPWADAVVAVSGGVADDLAESIGFDRSKIRVIYNPIVTRAFRNRAAEPLEDPWFAAGQPPVVLAVGGFRRQKDYATLLRAFAIVRRGRMARLLILGDGVERQSLETLADELGIRDDVRLPGFVPNPAAYMRRAGVYTMSSRWEGLPSVLIEALYCGRPIVSTDCPSGPREILRNGAYGKLVPPEAPEALAEGIGMALDGKVSPPPEESWTPFTEDAAVDAYFELMEADGHA